VSQKYVRGGARPPGRPAELAALRPYELHGTLYYAVLLRFDDAPDEPREARLSADMVYDAPAPGDRVLVEAVLGVVDRIVRAEAA
jgi:hypothetical protein